MSEDKKLGPEGEKGPGPCDPGIDRNNEGIAKDHIPACRWYPPINEGEAFPEVTEDDLPAAVLVQTKTREIKVSFNESGK